MVPLSTFTMEHHEMLTTHPRYSSEITGTILVQCIPVLRPILRNFSTTITSNRRISAATIGQKTVTNRFSSRTMSKEFEYDMKCQGSSGTALTPLREGTDSKWQGDRPLSSVEEESERPTSVDSWPLRQTNGSFVDLEHGKVYHAK